MNNVLTISSQHVAASVGLAKGDLEKLKDILQAVPQLSYICVDVANGYSEHFVEFVKEVRHEFPNHTIMVRTKLCRYKCAISMLNIGC